jgi:hypothetical protein
MNQKNVKKREVLEFKDFLRVASDPWNPKNWSKEDRTGLHKIKLERPFAYLNQNDAVFNHQSKIEYPGQGATRSGMSHEIGTTE